MSKPMMFILAALLCGGAAWGQKSALHVDAPGTALPPAAGAASDVPPGSAPVESLADRIAKMDLRQRVSQLMLATMQGVHMPSNEDITFLKAYTPGGVVLHQILQPAAAVTYIAKLRGVESVTGIPLLVGANLYELTKRDRNAPSAFVEIPPLLSVAATGEADVAARLARLWAAHLQGMGFNWCLGPHLRLAPTLPEAMGSIHCLGSDPAFAAKAGSAFIQTLSENNILPMPMDFPGGGSNHTPQSPAVLLTPKSLLAENDLLPYTEAVKNGAAMLHVGNTLVPTIDPMGHPACLSKAVMQDLLRAEMKYEGVIVAGPMDSPEITVKYDVAQAAIESLKNGADMLYWRSPTNTVMRAVDSIQNAVAQGELSEEAINAAVARVFALKTKMSEKKPPAAKESKASSLENSGDLAQEAKLIQWHAITLVQNRANVLPLEKKVSMPLGITGVTGVEELQKALEKHMKPVSAQVITTATHLGEIQDFEVTRITSRIRNFRTVVCVFTDALRPEGQHKLIQELKGLGAQVVVVLLGYPRNLTMLADADALLLGYCDSTDCGQTLMALADVLCGKAPARILTASSDAEMRAGEKRVFDARELVRIPAGRLPVTISDAFAAGLMVSYDFSLAVKKAEWDFGSGDRIKESRVEYAFEKPGEFPATLTITNKAGETVSRTFNIVVRE